MRYVLVETLAQKAPSLTTPTFCADPKSNALRLRSNLYAGSITRNNIGIFHDVNVALDYQISYGSKQRELMAIVGHVTAMQTFDPTQSQVALGARPADHYDASDIPELYIKGKALAQPFPDCCSETQTLQENVRVALRGVITKDGSVTGVVAMASPNKGLADRAVSSVSMWKYKPFVVKEGPVGGLLKLLCDVLGVSSGQRGTKAAVAECGCSTDAKHWNWNRCGTLRHRQRWCIYSCRRLNFMKSSGYAAQTKTSVLEPFHFDRRERGPKDKELLKLRSKILLTVLVSSAGLAVSRPVLYGQTPGQERLTKLYEANNLDSAGGTAYHQTPFHLKMTFQVYDMAGKAADQGTIEVTGAPGSDKQILIHSALLKENGAPLKDGDTVSAREAYLVGQLLDFALNPVDKPNSAVLVDEVNREFGKVVLVCVSRGDEPTGNKTAGRNLFCTEKDNDAVRFLGKPEGVETAVRNSIGVFHDTKVAMDVQILFEGRVAISAKVTTLQSAPSAVKTEEQAASSEHAPGPHADTASPSSHVAGGVVQGTRTKFVQPVYPQMARAARMSGVVLLHAIIAKDGTIQSLVPIASTDPIFTDAAFDAVRQWRYKPYELNGVPTGVDTMITVNFALGPQR